MELKLRSSLTNSYPIKGVLIKGASVKSWLEEIQRMGLSLDSIQVFALPGRTVNSLWGCLFSCNLDLTNVDIGLNSYCQLIHDILFVPESSQISPLLYPGHIEKLFKGQQHFFHPETGLVELAKAIDWVAQIHAPAELKIEHRIPALSIIIPSQIKSFQVKPVTPEKALEQFEEENFPIRQKFSEKPLNPFEKAKLEFYKLLFDKNNVNEKDGGSEIKGKPLLNKLERIKNLFSNKKGWAENLQTDFEELERRNQKHLDRLLDLLKNNPQEALKYAIPLDNDGTVRGGRNGQFGFQKRWLDFSLFGKIEWGNGGGSIIADDAFFKLRQQYSETAENLIRQKEYQKAAFIYMKLLRDHDKAAQTMENAKYFQEAASIYLKYLQNKKKAAECYERGEMTGEAINLFSELGENEKVGDLYAKIQKRELALEYYKKVVDHYTTYNQYVKASLLYKNKMQNKEAGQELLIEGWRKGKDAFNCLNNYFTNIDDIRLLDNELKRVYQKEVDGSNRETFLQVIKIEFDKRNELSDSIKEMGHEIIVAQIPKNPSIVSELRAFNKTDKQLVKDTMRFKLRNKK